MKTDGQKQVGGAIDYLKLGKQVRRRVVDAMVASGRGHLGAAFSIVEILNVLYEGIVRHDPSNPGDPNRDRVILSKGHGCLALYAVLARRGYFPDEELLRFCKPGGILGGHPDHRKIPGVETSTGSLGHGLAVGIGMALGARLDQKDYRVFVILGDGECNEGSIWEAALHAAKHRLDHLVVLVDYNKMQSFGPTRDILDLEPLADKWRAFGFETREIRQDAPASSLEDLLKGAPFGRGKPNAVIYHSIKGKGVSFAENSASWHHKNKLTPEEVRAMYAELAD